MHQSIVFVAALAKLAHINKFEVVGQNSSSCEIDTPSLFVGHGLTATVMAIGIDHHRQPATELLRFVQQSRYPKTGQRFVTEFLDAIAIAVLKGVEPLDSALCVAPVRGFALEDDGVKHLGARASCCFEPGLLRRWELLRLESARRRTAQLCLRLTR